MSVSVSKQIIVSKVSDGQREYTTSLSLNDQISSLIRSGEAFLMEPKNLQGEGLGMAKAIRESVCLPSDWEGSVEILRQDRMR